MKSKILIKYLQEIDPDGETEVFVGGTDIYFVEKLPYYYDGKPNILIRDETKENYNIIGLKQLSGGNKIELKTLDLEDIIDTDINNEGIYEGDERFKERIDKTRKSRDKILRDIDLESFKEFLTNKFGLSQESGNVLWVEDICLFFNQYEKQLRRQNFSSIGSSFREKQWNYWADCVKLENEKLKYIDGFEDESYEIK